jgi:hypothetical protein
MNIEYSDPEVQTSALLVSGAVTVFILTVILFLTPEAGGYEFSVYRGYPAIFWGLVVGGLFIGQLVIVRATIGTETTIRSWPFGVVLIMAVEALLFLLPYFRGYQAYDRADVLTHVGFIRNIHILGDIPPSDIYPNIHLLTLTFSYATGIEPLHIINGISVVIPLFSVVAWYALIRRLYDGERALLTLPFALVLVAGGAYVNPSPFTQSSVFIPFVLYLFVRERQTRSIPSRVALVLTSIALVIYHPLTTVFLIFGLISYFVATSVRNWKFPVVSGTGWTNSRGKGLPIQLMAVLFLSWYYSFDPILNRSQEAIQSLVGTSDSQSTLDQYGSVVSETSPQISDLLRIGFSKYGISGLLMGIAGLYILLMCYNAVSRKAELSDYELSFSLSFIGFTLLSVLFLAFDLVAGFGRPLIYVNIFAVLLSGPLFWNLYQQFDINSVVTGLLCVLLFAHVVFGVVTLYHSPVQAETSHQVTEVELEGSQWLLDHRDQYMGTVEYGISFYRFGDAYYGNWCGYIADAADDP